MRRIHASVILENIFLLTALVVAVIWILDGRPNAKIGPVQDPTFLFSIEIYAIQAYFLTRYFRARGGFVETVGYVSSGLISSYGLYEAIFKVSFPMVDPNPYRIDWFFNVDLVPFVILFTAIPAYLPARRYWDLSRKNRPFWASLLIAVSSWISWWLVCFPLNIQEYERVFMPCEYAHNVLTKAATSSLYLTILKWRG